MNCLRNWARYVHKGEVKGGGIKILESPFFIPGPAGISILYKFLQFPSSYEFLYLLFQVFAIFCVMVVIFMETAVFPLVMNIG